MIEIWSWNDEVSGDKQAACDGCSPQEVTDNDSPSSATRKRPPLCDGVPVLHVSRYGYNDPEERRRARYASKRRSRRSSPTSITKLKHKYSYRSYSDNSQDYEDDRERAVSFSLEKPTVIFPSTNAPQKEKLQVMVQSDDGDVFSLEFDEFTDKELASSLRRSNSKTSVASDDAAESNDDVSERSLALNDVWVGPPSEDSPDGEENPKEEGDGDAEDNEDSVGKTHVLDPANERKNGYQKVRPYVRKLSAREQKHLYRKRPDLSPEYPKMFMKKSGRELEEFYQQDAVEEQREETDPDSLPTRGCIFFELLI